MEKKRRSVLGLELSRSVIVTLLILAVTAIAVFLALVSLQDSNIFTTGTQAANDTNAIIGNITTGTTSFFSYVPTWMILLAVVVLIAIIAIVIVVVSKLEGGRGGSPAAAL
jgi:hypothetical protein